MNNPLAAVPLPQNKVARNALATVAVAALLLLLTKVIEPNGTGGHGVPLAVLFDGFEIGLSNGLIAAALILVFRINRIINFASLAVGIPAALAAFETLYYTQIPLPIDIIGALVVGGALGAIIELVFGRFFATRSRLQFTIITAIGSSLLIGPATNIAMKLPWLPPLKTRDAAALTTPDALLSHLPQPGLHFTIAGFTQQFHFGDLLAIELSFGALILLTLFLRFSRFGVALRSVAQNTERAELLGINTGLIGTITWAISGVLATIAILNYGFEGNPGIAIGGGSTADLITPLAAAVLARFTSVPAAFAWSIALGILDQSFTDAYPSGQLALSMGLPLLFLVVALLLQRKGLTRLAGAEAGSWRLAAEQKRVPRELAGLTGLVVSRVLIVLVLLGLAIGAPFVVSAGTTSTLSLMLLEGIAALSLVVLTGWGGQVNFGVYAFISIGAVVAGGAADRGHVPFLLAIPLGAIVCAGFAVIVGLPALRVKGLFLGVVTFTLVPAVGAVLFNQKLFGGWLLPSQIIRPDPFGLNFDSEKSYYFLSLVVLIAVALLVRNLRSTRLGRIIIASRDNEAALQATGVPLVRTKLIAFAISGGLAGLAGGLIGFQLRGILSTSFTAQPSLLFFGFIVVGGVSSIQGALTGTVLFTLYAHYNSSIFQSVALLLVVTILYVFPGGLFELFTIVRDSVLRIVAQRRQIIVPSLLSDDAEAESELDGLVPLGAAYGTSGLAALPHGLTYKRRSRIHGLGSTLGSGASDRDERALVAASAAFSNSDQQGDG